MRYTTPRILCLTLLAWLGSSAHAQNMPLNAFLAKAEGLKKMGMAAMFSNDLKMVIQEGKGMYAGYAAEAQAGHAGCAPKDAKLNRREIMQGFRQIPATERANMTTGSAYIYLVRKKYPCQ